MACSGNGGNEPIEKQVVGQPFGLGASFVSLFSPSELEAIRQIDLRQIQLLEDLDALNERILGILKEHGFVADSQSPPAESLGALPQFPLPDFSGDGSDELESAA